MKKILIVEDDQDISAMLVASLSDDFELEVAYSGREALFQIGAQNFDLILLDLMLPGLSGDEAIIEIKMITSTPIIIMSALSASEKIIELLEKGANDYITKPFDVNVLKARIQTQLRLVQPNTVSHDNVSYGTLTLNIERFEVCHNHVPFVLSNKELHLLHTLMSNPQKVYSKAELYEKVWQDEYLYDENTMNVHISSLRRKVKNACDGYDPIETLWGIGIRMGKVPEL
ncbi:response regulator transcription factor [Erysipelothrix sp. HDW6C]|uniref:response regulator transcription factor n=1 Tax=Erysipelothrix sp. HDW6C TaxID=2714930 RepID=UPI00140B0BD9|nr:response regulator transcription factor [Erysipelothrix sp. HDW6C]QIK69164.1 response regulator transcription factor [Erysipelothrix sp. HDW6C]